jgi:hypothetical protein
MITERTLRKWRKQALEAKLVYKSNPDDSTDLVESFMVVELSGRILSMTQELLDQHLMRRPSR